MLIQSGQYGTYTPMVEFFVENPTIYAQELFCLNLGDRFSL